jgi:aryl-alcohol dehydrogenase-like predicted oxidoreductase
MRGWPVSCIALRWLLELQKDAGQMTLRKLGNSDLEITPIGVGAWAIGGGQWEFGWGPQEDTESIMAIHTALDRGMNWIDTAAAYGLGHSETVVGRAIGGLRPRPYVFTKCSLVWDESGKISHNLQAASIRKEAEASLQRLNVETIDLYQIHWPAWQGNPQSASPGSIEEAVGAMAKLKAEGKIRYIGVSNFDSRQMERAMAVAPITSIQPPYSLLATEVESATLPFALKHDIGVIVYSPMASGLLTGAMTRERIARLPEDDWRKRSPNFQEPLLTRNLRLVELLRTIGQRRKATPGEVAIAWTLKNPAVTGAIVGIRSEAQVNGIAGAPDVRLSPEELWQIKQTLTQQAA